jgi:hypothetical protein
MDGNWQYAGVVAGFFYLITLSLVPVRWSLPDLLLWLQLPIYIAHQFEEHVHDRFRQYVNSHLGQGRQILTPRAVTIINVGGVWCVDFLAIYLAGFYWRGAGLLAFYLALVNAVGHLAGALISRAYNPGLFTAAILFLPLGAWGTVAYSTAYNLPARDHIAAVVFAVALHAVIIGHVLRRRAQFPALNRPRPA